MITNENLGIYLRFGGDDDGWSRAGCPGSHAFAETGWTSIRDLLQEITLVKKRLATPEYEARIREKIERITESRAVANRLFEVA